LLDELGVTVPGRLARGQDPIRLVEYAFSSSVMIVVIAALAGVHQHGLQYRKIGRRRDYLYGERADMLFSLIAKSLLAWQVFFGTLRP